MIYTRTNPKNSSDEKVETIGSQIVSAYEADLIASCEQRRLSLGGVVAERTAALRAEMNRIDELIDRIAEELAAAEESRGRELDGGKFKQPWPASIYWLAMLAIATLEVGVNKLAFDYMASDDKASWALAAMVSVLLFVLGKFTGKMLRQKPWLDGNWTPVWLAAPFNALIIGLAWFIGSARETMAEAMADAEQVPLIEGIGLGFGLILALGYGVVVFASYWFTDPSEKREQADARLRELEPKLTRMKRKRERLARQHNAGIAKARASLERLSQNCIQRALQFRDGNLQSNSSAASFLRLPLTTSLFKPIHIGAPIDVEPKVRGHSVSNDSNTKGL